MGIDRVKHKLGCDVVLNECNGHVDAAVGDLLVLEKPEQIVPKCD